MFLRLRSLLWWIVFGLNFMTRVVGADDVQGVVDLLGDDGRNGGLEKAQVVCSRLLNQDSANAVALCLRGYIQKLQKKEKGARDDFAAALKIDPKVPEKMDLMRIEQGGRGAWNAIVAQVFFFRGYSFQIIAELGQTMADLNKAIEISPKTAWEAYIQRAYFKGEKRDLAGALGDCDEAIRLNPRYAGAYFRRGEFRRKQKDLAGCVADLTQAIEVNPQYAIAYSLRGSVRAEMNDLNGALADVNRGVALDPSPDIPDNYLERGVVRLRTGDLEGALADLNRVIEIWPTERALLERAKVRRAKGDQAGAVADEKISKTYAEREPGAPSATASAPAPTNAPVKDSATYYKSGLSRHDQGDLQGSVADFNLAIELNPKYAEAYYGRGITRRDLGQLDEAIRDLTQAIELSPAMAVAYNHRGIARLSKQDWDGAIVDFNRAIELNPQYALAFSHRGAAEAGKRDFLRAVGSYDQALRLNSKDEQAYLGRGRCRLELKDRAGAKTDFSTGLKLNPKNVQLLLVRAYVEAEDHEVSAALVDLSRALEINSRIPDIYRKRGELRAEAGDLAGAMGDFGRALELDAKDAGTYNSRGYVRMLNGDLDFAMSDFNRALVINPQASLFHTNRGFACYLQRKWDKALEDFTQAGAGTDPLAYAWLYEWVVHMRLGQGVTGSNNLRTHLSQLGIHGSDFFSVLADFLLGKSSEAQVMAAATTADAAETLNQVHQAWYFAGMKRLSAKETKEAADCFRKCMTYAGKSTFVQMAGLELKMLEVK